MINQEFFAALNDLVKEKGISRESFIETLQNALASAYKKQYDNGAEISVELDPDSGNIEFLASRRVVAEVEDRDKEISVEEAQQINPDYREGGRDRQELRAQGFRQNRDADRQTGDFAEAARSGARQHFLRPFRQGRGAYGMHRPQTRRQKRVRRIGG